MIIQNRYKLIVICFLFLLPYPVLAQTGTSKVQQKNNEIYISSGQDQTVYLKENTSVKINTIFYPQLTYKIEIISEDPGSIIEMALLTQEGKKYFTNSDKNYIKFWHFCFQSVSCSTIELYSRNRSKKEQQVQIKISYLHH